MTEIVKYEQPGMLNPATDSWTAVVEDVGTLAGRIAGTDFVPDSFRGKPAQVAAAILHGRELGLEPLTALSQTHIVNGRPGISAEAMRALILQAGHEIAVSEVSGSRCVIKGRRAGSEEWTTVGWTLDDARTAGLLGKGPWKQYPRAMLLARATTELARMIFADVIHGLQSIEELRDMGDEGPVEEPTTKVTQVRRKPRRVSYKREEKPAPDVEAETPQTGAGGGGEATESPEDGGSPPAPPTRKRPDLPAPKTAGPSVPTTEEVQKEIRDLADEKRRLDKPEPDPQQAEEGPDEDGAYQAELVEESETSVPRLTAGQRAAVIMHFERLGIKDRDERLYWTGLLAGRGEAVSSSNNVTRREAVTALENLETFRDRDQLEAFGAEAGGDDA